MTIIEKAIEDAGHLLNNNTIVESLRSALIGGQRSVTMVPMCLDETIRECAWQDRQDVNSRRFRCGSFIEFIESPEPKGLGTTDDAIRKYLGDSTNPLRVKFEKLLPIKKGPPLGNTNNPSGLAKPTQPNPNPNNVRVWVSGEEIGQEPPVSASDSDRKPPSRDRSREPQAGNSIGYAVRRLAREAERNPDGEAANAYRQLKAGGVTAHGAMVQAGLKDKAITIPADPLSPVSLTLLGILVSHPAAASSNGSPSAPLAIQPRSESVQPGQRSIDGRPEHGSGANGKGVVVPMTSSLSRPVSMSAWQRSHLTVTWTLMGESSGWDCQDQRVEPDS